MRYAVYVCMYVCCPLIGDGRTRNECYGETIVLESFCCSEGHATHIER